jgi:hemolysin activation/secretion protein
MWLHVSAVAFAICFGATVAHSQTVFDADSQIRRQTEQIEDVRTRNSTAAKSDLQAAIAPTQGLLPQEAPCFTISHVRVTGFQAPRHSQALAGGRLDDPPEGRCIGAAGIQVLLARLQNALVAHGYITARVSAPDQDLRTGDLHLHIKEGRLGSVRLRPEDFVSLAIRSSALAVRAGETLNLRDVEQTLDNLRRLPSAAPTMEIAPGNETGESVLNIDLQPFKPLRASLGLDDAGTRTTGRLQASATVHWDNPLSLADTFYLHTGGGVADQEDGPRGQDNHVMHYSVPLGYWSVSASANRSKYHQQVAGAFQNYRYSGHSQGFELGASRVILRASDRKTSLSLHAFARRSANFIDDTEVVVQRRRTGGWELGAQHQQTFALVDLDIDYTYKRGTGAFGALPAPEETFGEGTSRMRYSQLGVRAQLPLHVLENDGVVPALHMQWEGQWAHSSLTPQDRRCFGGRYTVRGFDGKAAMCGESGWTVRSDVAIPFKQFPGQVYIGLDGGRARGPSAGPSPWLLGAALGLRGTVHPHAAGRLQFDAFVAWPLRKPAWFNTAHATSGFSLQLQF